MRNVLIIGAGDAGKMTAHEIQNHPVAAQKYRIIGFLDDDPDKKEVLGLSVIGRIADAKRVVADHGVDELIIAIPSADGETVRKILFEVTPTEARIKIVPGLFEIIEGDVSYRQIRDFEPSDLLGREEVGFDTGRLKSFYEKKTVLVTGGGGSIGSEIVTQLLSLPVKKVIAYGHGENSIFQLIEQFGTEPRFGYVIGDIRDDAKLRTEMAFHRPDIVFHAAAHKHVPLMEEFPDEAVKNNVIGTYRVAHTAINTHVSRLVMISTDKAVQPASVMGATKRIAERIVLSLNRLQGGTRLSVVRFGNVLGSRGSVVNLFKKQIERGGPVTVTDPDMERYWMSIREAARLVIKSAQIDHAPICVLDMGSPIRIDDLARNMIRLAGFDENEVPVTYTGIRPGEKLTERLHYPEETLMDSGYKKILLSQDNGGLLSAQDLETLLTDMDTVSNSTDPVKIKLAIAKYVPGYEVKHA